MFNSSYIVQKNKLIKKIQDIMLQNHLVMFFFKETQQTPKLRG